MSRTLEIAEPESSTWWSSPEWLAYEAAGGYPSRVEELAQATWQTRVIDLSLSEAELWRGVRKSYKPLINKRISEVGCYHHTAGTALFAEDRLACVASVLCCQVMHYIQAGRETRPQDTWDMMGQWLLSGKGLVASIENRASGGYAYFIIYGQWSYYASAASLTRNVNHALIWHAMKALKARNVRWLEMGWQGHAQDEKGHAIEFFRRGFGGFDMAAKDAPRLAFA